MIPPTGPSQVPMLETINRTKPDPKLETVDRTKPNSKLETVVMTKPNSKLEMVDSTKQHPLRTNTQASNDDSLGSS